MDQPIPPLADRPRRLTTIRALSLVLAFGIVQLIITGIMDAYPVLYYVVGFSAALVVVAALLAGATRLAEPFFRFVEERQNVSESRKQRDKRFNAEIAALTRSTEPDNQSNRQSDAPATEQISEALRLIVGEGAKAGMTRREVVYFVFGLTTRDSEYKTACRRVDRAANLAGVELPAQQGPQAPIRTFYLTTDD